MIGGGIGRGRLGRRAYPVALSRYAALSGIIPPELMLGTLPQTTAVIAQSRFSSQV
jgi:hypothetical protein